MTGMLSMDGRWCLVYAIVGYLAGGILFCDLLLRGLKRVDVFRAAEDGNPGTHNAFQLGGLWCGLGTLLGDLAKGFFPVWLCLRRVSGLSPLLSLTLLAPVLGHAVAPFDRFHGGKCIATAFGEMIALLPVSRIVLGLAGLYIFFSTVWKINPNRVRSIVVFGLFGLGSGVWFWMQNEPAMLIGCLCISATAILKHSKWLTSLTEKPAEAEAEKKAESL